MKHLFIGKTFTTAEELLTYLLSIKDRKFDQPYGVYCAKMYGAEKQFEFIEDFSFPSLQIYRDTRKKLIEYGENTTVTLYFRKGRLYCLSLTSDTLETFWDKNKGQWKETCRDNYNIRQRWLKVTDEEKRAAVRGLFEMLSMKADEVA